MEKSVYPPEELLALVGELAYKYIGCDSTSLPYEKAQDLLEAVLYHLAVFDRWMDGGLPVANLSVKAAYQAGYQLVLDKMHQLVEVYNRLANDFCDYGQKVLHDTMRLALPEFLRRYDARFCPQDTLLTLDYPTLAPFYGLEGVDKIYQYVLALGYEQTFLRQFPPEYVVSVLRAYHPHYEELVENICVIVLQNVLGHLWLDKPLDEPLCDSGRQALSAQLALLTSEETECLVERGVRRLSPPDEDWRWYIAQAIPDMATRIRFGAKNRHLRHIFVL